MTNTVMFIRTTSVEMTQRCHRSLFFFNNSLKVTLKSLGNLNLKFPPGAGLLPWLCLGSQNYSRPFCRMLLFPPAVLQHASGASKVWHGAPLCREMSKPVFHVVSCVKLPTANSNTRKLPAQMVLIWTIFKIKSAVC